MSWSKDTWSLFLMVLAIAVAVSATIYIIPKLSDEGWDDFVISCKQDGGVINSANQCIIPIDDRIYITRSITGIQTYCTMPTNSCGR